MRDDPRMVRSLIGSLIAAVIVVPVVACATAVEAPAATRMAPSAAATAPSETPAVETGRSVQAIETRPGVTLRFMLDVPARPVGTVVLLVGSDGRGAFVQVAGQVIPGPNFLARTTPEFTSRGMAVALVDVPSDQPGGISSAFRSSPQHLEDIFRLVSWLGTRGLGSIHLVGTSRGSISAAYAGISLTDPQVGKVVLTSSVSDVAALSLEGLRRPTLVVHNRDDACVNSPFSSALVLRQRIAGAAFVEAHGGTDAPTGVPFSGPCDPFSRHGYLGIEAPVVQAIVDWLAGKAPPAVVP